MPFIGQNPSVGGYNILDDITISTNTNGPFNLLLNGAAFKPESANHLLVSLNGVIQKPDSSFTVSGSQITFTPSSGTLTSSDSIDFIMVLGNVLNVGTPTDGTISTNKIASNAVTGAKIAPTITTNHTFSGTLEVPAATSGWRHIKTLTGANHSSVDFLHGVNGVVFDDTYDVYEFIVHYVYGGGVEELRIEPHQGDGVGFSATNTVGHATSAYRSGGTSSTWNVDTGANGFYKQNINSGNAQNEISGGQIRVYSPFDSAKNTVSLTTFASYQDTGTYASGINVGAMTVAGRTHGLRFRIVSNNIYAKISLYGLKDA
jgi:hypothetical protein